MSAEFAAQTAVVTGAASGIGRATARLLADRGATVVIGDIADPDLSGYPDGSAHYIPVDVRDEDSVEEFARRVVEEHAKIDIAVLNAATIQPLGGVLDTTTAQWDETFAINVRGAFLTARGLLRTMVAGTGGSACLVASETVLRTPKGYAAYVASKHAVVGLTRSLAVDYGPHGVRVNAVLPGLTLTEGLRATFPTDDGFAAEVAQATELSPLHKVLDPVEVANVIAFACSPRASGMTGAALVVDAGVTIGYPDL